MLTSISEAITDYLVNKGSVKSEEKEIYSYGFEMGIVMLANLLTSVLIGLALGMLVECIVFLLAYLPLRSFAGGYHASNHLRCYFLSSTIIILVLLAIRSTLALNLSNGSMALVACSTIIIYLTSPVQDNNKPLDLLEKKVYARNSRIILLIELCLYLIFIIFQWATMVLVITSSLVVMSLTLFIGYAKNQYSS